MIELWLKMLRSFSKLKVNVTQLPSWVTRTDKCEEDPVNLFGTAVIEFVSQPIELALGGALNRLLNA